jgi:hypothetical protein
LGTTPKITLIENHTVTAGKFSKGPASSLFFEENQALNYAEGRASFRSGEIRIIDSTGEVERTIPNSPKRIEVVTAEGAERFSGCHVATFLLTGLVEFQEATLGAPRANGRTLNHSQFLEDKDAGDIVRMDLGDERFCRSPERDNLAFCSSTFAVRAGHRTAHQPLDGYAGRETAAPEIPAKSTPAISMASPLSTFTPASSRTLHSSSGYPDSKS